MTAFLDSKQKVKQFTRAMCWVCKKWYGTLYKVGDFDYTCEEHKVYGKPDIENQSKERVGYEPVERKEKDSNS